MSKITNFDLKWGDFRLHIGSLEILDHQVNIISAPSGSGKTSFFESLVGMHEYGTWGWEYEGMELSNLSPSARRIGYVPQDSVLFSGLTVKENIFSGFKGNLILEQEVVTLANELGLESLLDRDVQSLSGGEKQRVAFVRGLASEPKILILDEPFSALDLALKNRCIELLLDYVERYRLTVIIATHDKTDVTRLGGALLPFLDETQV
jgi:ABC-type sugar transport system ATPase subunit